MKDASSPDVPIISLCHLASTLKQWEIDKNKLSTLYSRNISVVDG